MAVLLFSAPALAQHAGATTGFPIGEKSRIHTHLDLAVGVDSNSLRQRSPAEGEVGGPDPESDWKAQIKPGVSVEVPGTSAALSLRSYLLIEQFFGSGSNASDTEVGGSVGADLRLGSAKSVVGLELKDTLTRTPFTFEDLGTIGSDELLFPVWYNRGRVNGVLRPGGGALEFRLGYGNEMRFFDEQLPDSQRHAAEFEAKLKFLPKTAAIFAADMSFFSAETDPEDGPTGATNRATPYNVWLGLQGQITSRISGLARVGFGDTLSWTGDYFSEVAPQNIRTVIAGVNLTYDFFAASSISVGYDRAVRPIILLDTYTSDSVSARLTLGVGDRLAFGLMGIYEHRAFGDDPNDPSRPADLSSDVVIGDARVEYWFFEFLRAGLAYSVINQSADDASVNLGLYSYTRHQGMLTAGLFY